MDYAPIIVFAFNRLDVLMNTINSLKRNPEAKESDLYVFVDGPRLKKEGEEGNFPHDYTADTYFCTRSSSWGWATWADRWASVDWELMTRNDFTTRAKAFKQWGNSDC